ncbi:hypothetical protein [Flavobacterium sp.]|jgi:hypothetical protein|uniref:hypothetical protein n=1 Tax=Flavobacterium sp. TaxID=239 RepID=UPI0037C11D81
MERENFINEILNSVEGIVKVKPNEALFQKIEQRIQETTVSLRTLWLVAVSTAVMIAINLFLISGKPSSGESKMASLEHSINKSNQLYK